jgi:hypothetical protein
VVARTRLNVRFILPLPVLLFHAVYKLDAWKFHGTLLQHCWSHFIFQCSLHLCQQCSFALEQECMFPPRKTCRPSSAATGRRLVQARVTVRLTVRGAVSPSCFQAFLGARDQFVAYVLNITISFEVPSLTRMRVCCFKSPSVSVARIYICDTHCAFACIQRFFCGASSARRRGRYLRNTQTQETNIHALSRIRTPVPSSQVAADQRLRPGPHGHRDRPCMELS